MIEKPMTLWEGSRRSESNISMHSLHSLACSLLCCLGTLQQGGHCQAWSLNGEAGISYFPYRCVKIPQLNTWEKGVFGFIISKISKHHKEKDMSVHIMNATKRQSRENRNERERERVLMLAGSLVSHLLSQPMELFCLYSVWVSPSSLILPRKNMTGIPRNITYPFHKKKKNALSIIKLTIKINDHRFLELGFK